MRLREDISAAKSLSLSLVKRLTSNPLKNITIRCHDGGKQQGKVQSLQQSGKNALGPQAALGTTLIGRIDT